MVDFTSIESKWQKRWFEEKVFEPSHEDPSKPKSKKFMFTVPYPYVSGNLHVGHGRTYVNGDVMMRFKRMQGNNVLWPIAFHITGTPVLAISNKIERGDEKTIKLYEEYVGVYETDKSKVPAIVKSFVDPWKLVNYFSGKMVYDFKSMGFSLDLSRQFTTGDKEYNKFVEWQFHKFKKAGYLKQASYPILYCTTDKNAVGEDDIQDADTVPVEVQRFTAFKFKLPDGRFIVTATLRADTAFGVTNVFVNPDADYVEVEVTNKENKKAKKEVWLLSKKGAEKLSYQNVEVKERKNFKGSELVAMQVETPTGTTVPVLPAAFVDVENATGFVHSVPAHAPFDLVAIEELKTDKKTLDKYPALVAELNKIKLLPVISSSNYSEFSARDLVTKLNIKNTRQADLLKKATQQLYKDEFYAGKVVNSKQFTGLSVQEAKDKIANWLASEGKASVFFETSRDALCRCGGEVICAVLPDQWFLDFNAPGWKEKANACLEKMEIYPANYRKQFEDIFAWLDKRPCARRRGLGTQLPFANEWIIESLSDSTIYPAFYTVIKPIREAGLKPEQLTEEFFDYVFTGKGSASEVAKKIGAHAAAVDRIKHEFEYWYPNDQRHTAIAHISNHLSFYIFAHTAIFGEKFWPKAISVNELLISEGTKMSKSKGNVVSIDDVRRNYSADLYRLYAVASADFASVLDFRKKDMEGLRRAFNKWFDTLHEMSQLSKTDSKTKSSTKAKTHSTNSSSSLVKWMVSKFESAVRDSTVALEGKQLREYSQVAFYKLLNNWEHFSHRASDEEKAEVARAITSRWILLMTPLAPHACEELWEIYNARTDECAPVAIASLTSWPSFNAKLIDKSAERNEDYVQSVVEDVRKLKEMLTRKGSKLSKVTLITASEAKWKELEKLMKKETLEEAVAGTKDEGMKKHLEKWFWAYKEASTSKLDEAHALEEAAGFLEKDLGLKINIEKEEKSKLEKATRAMPLKPSVVLE